MQRGRGSSDSRGGRGDFRGGSRGGRGRGGPPPSQDYRGGPSPSRGFEGRGGRGGPQRGGRGRGGPPASTGPLIFSPGGEARLNSQERTAEDSLVQRFKTMNIQQDEELQPVLRPGYGTKGSAIVVRTNYFQITREPPTLYEYKIYYQPDAKNKRIRRRILQILEDSPAFQPYKDHLAHDGSEKLISTKKLPSPNQNPLELKVKFFDEGEEPDNKSKIYTLSFSFTGELTKQEIDKHLQGIERQNVAPYIAALNILAAKEAGRNGIRVGGDRYFFKSAGPSFNLGGGIEAWRGFYSSVRPTLNSLMINVNVCYTAFYQTGKLSDAIEAFQRASFSADPSRFVDRLRVQVTHLPYRPKKTIYRLAKPATQCTFQCQEYGGSITVQEYFLKKYKIQLQKPRWVVDVGKPKDPRYVPAELLEILPDQPFRGKLLDTHTAEMIKFACRKPADNARSIMNEGLPSLGFNQAVKKLGIDISTEMAVVPARVLSPPTVVYNGGRARINNDKASWNLQNQKFYKGMQLKNWGIFIINTSNEDFQDPTDPRLLELIRIFAESAGSSGITVADRPTILGAKLDQAKLNNSRILQNFLLEKLKPALAARLSFLLVILSTADKRIYGSIRRICDVELGISATCVQSQKIRSERGQPQYIANVCMKINAKLGGVNHALDSSSASWLSKELTMLVGMDVTHPGPGSIKGTPSIAGVVASCDSDFALYPASLKLQKTKQEMIEDLTDMMVERLLFFRQKRNALPKRIIVFRDGVSEGQFSTVLHKELSKILEAFKKVGGAGPPYKPKLTIIICGKRHHTRFYPISEGSADQLGNPKPGTVVDRGVTAIFEFDFFLQAHSGLQGATRPTHYTVIYDQNKFDADAAQSLINYSSYIFARSTRAVSLVPPAYYADLACERGRLYIQEFLNAPQGSLSGKSSTTQEEAVYNEVEKQWGHGIHPNIRSTMFYI